MSEKRIGAAKFKEQCLAILDSLDPEGIVITKHGRPVAHLVPIPASPADLIGVMKGRLKTGGKDDLFSTGVTWDAES